MSTQYAEKRNFFRMNLECIAEYTINGSGDQKSGTVTNLSGDGISIVTDEAASPGTQVRISIQPDNDVTPALEVVMEVLRCEEQNGDAFLLAGNMIKQ